MRGRLPGSVLLFDAEGSTRLAAELSAYATAGAEVLADVLTAVFTPIVDTVHRFGGSVVQFTGDGVLAVFPGPPHHTARAAATAGVEIRDALSSLDALDTPAGSAHLTLRGVVTTGSIEWVVWNASDVEAQQRRIFAFMGSAVAEAERGEALVAGEQLAICEGTASLLASGATVATLGDGFLLLNGIVESAEPGAAVRHVELPEIASQFNPPRVLHFDGRGEFRDVVSAFVSVREEGESLWGGAAPARVLDLVGAHDGYVCDVIRTGSDDDSLTVFAFWGAPTTHEHDVEHAARCMLAIRETLGADAVKAGVTAETVYAGFVGSARQEAYTCVGSGVNLAARMGSDARWGEIRIGARIPARLPSDTRHSSLGKMPYRGFAEPVMTHLLEAGSAGPLSDVTDPMIGRNRELARLMEVLHTVQASGSALTTLVTGDAGVGKSHLLDALHTAFIADEPRTLWLRTRADEVRRDPFGPIRLALLTYFGRDDDAAAAGRRLESGVRTLIRRNPDLADELDVGRETLVRLVTATPWMDDDVSARIRFENTVLAIETLLIAETRGRRVIVDVRDGQWLDPSAVSLLARLRGDLADHPITFLIESREALDVGADSTVELVGLAAEETRELAEGLLGAPVAESTLGILMDRTGGNPFFVHQVVRFLEEQDLLVTGAAGVEMRFAGARVPTDLRPILIARLDRLTEDVRRTVLTASVLGREFELAVLSAMLNDHDGTVAAVREAANRAIWSEINELRYLFRQAMLRDAAYEIQLHSALRSLHRAAANAIVHLYGTESAEHAAALAEHLDRAGAPEEALPHYVTAGREAARHFANEQAIADLERARDIVGDSDPGLRYRIIDALVDVYDVTGDRDRQGEAISELRNLSAVVPSRRLDAAHSAANWHIALAEYEAAREVVDEALDDSPATDPSVATLLLTRARINRHLGEPDGAERAARRAGALAEAADDLRTFAAAQDLLGGLAWERGDYATAVVEHREAAHLFATAGDRVGEISALNNLGSALITSGDYAAARVIHSAGIRRSIEIGYRLAHSDHLDNRGGTAWAVGRYAAAKADYEAALAIRRRLHDAWGIAISLGNLGGVNRALGDLDLARAQYEEALAVDRSIGRRRGEAFSLHGLGLVHRDAGALSAARVALEQAVAVRTEIGERHLANESTVALADVLRRTGDITSAAALVDEAMRSEGSDRFGAAIETTAALLHCYHVLAETAPDRATELLATMAAAIQERSSRISDEEQRRSYLHDVPSHAEVLRLATIR